MKVTYQAEISVRLVDKTIESMADCLTLLLLLCEESSQ
jgi:hypothetical protein